ncbi:NUDIX hydrolase [Cryptosporangium minutisporangium]|uniref:NUDIX hydrolase n=1 Tax=Cryptosporangium minutisporangium TaxID=113569 RepID=A0ABP6SYV3_9ACTN
MTTLTRATAAAGALFLDGQDRVMLVRPTYKDHWEIPGGMIEAGESPRDACLREVEEELGLRAAIGDLLVVDWAPHPVTGDKYLFVFAAARLTDAEHAAIRLQESELSEYRYVPLADLDGFTIPRMTARLTSAYAAAAQGRTLYLEYGVSR